MEEDRVMLMWDGHDWYSFPRDDWEIILEFAQTETNTELAHMLQLNYAMTRAVAIQIAICTRNDSWRIV